MLRKRDPSVQNRYLFVAMNSPCEVQFDCENTDLINTLGRHVEEEARRIEAKYSRYKSDSMLSKVNRSNGLPVEVDTEMMALLQYAHSCYGLSDGLFDITSGVLRRVWRFDGSDKIPKSSAINALLPFIGWEKVTLGNASITVPKGMEIDFGGLGKEYAVDSAYSIIAAQTNIPFLVNFGGDLRVSGTRRDARRFIIKNGKRYGHILNPLTGQPVRGAPRSITIAANTCLEAGIMSTLAMAKGRGAETFVKDEGLQAWIIR